MLHRIPFRAMASPCELQLHSDDSEQVDAGARAAIAEVARIERKYSRYLEDSLASRINASAGSPAGFLVDDETAALLDYAETAWEHSDGLFDISSGVLREVWDFHSGRLPDPEAIERVLERVGWERARWHGSRLWLAAGMQIDFGGFGKEYAADRAAETCREHGIRSGLVDLGGDVSLVGPHPNGEGWRVGVRDPGQLYGAVASVSLREGGIATSGDYQRFMMVDGKRYAHILDPRTGWPVAGLSSVSVIASHCLVAGTASTIAMLKGEDAAAWLDTLDLPNLRVDAHGKVTGSLAPGYDCAGVQGAPDETAGLPPSRRKPGLFAMASSPGSTTT
jgi:thiamine biosynthesis lipoprotein